MVVSFIFCCIISLCQITGLFYVFYFFFFFTYSNTQTKNHHKKLQQNKPALIYYTVHLVTSKPHPIYWNDIRITTMMLTNRPAILFRLFDVRSFSHSYRTIWVWIRIIWVCNSKDASSRWVVSFVKNSDVLRQLLNEDR